MLAAGLAALLFAAAVVVGRAVEHAHHTLHVGWPPLYANWLPHTGPGTPAALAVAAAVVAYGPVLADRLSWRVLVPGAWVVSMAWIWSLALVDGWQRGVAGRLTAPYEYLRVIDRFHDVGAALRDFTHHILLHSPDHWPPHVAGHPPAATLTFVGLDRIGLGGGGWAGAWCITLGGSAAAAVLVALRALTDAATARRAAPFLVLAPGAVWIGASADGYFAAVAAWAVALLAVATARRGAARAAAAFGSGLLFGLTAYLSYGLTVFALFAAAVLLLTHRRSSGSARTGGSPVVATLPWLLAGAAVVPVAFALAGFDYGEAYRLLVQRYYQGAGGVRPYAYWVWADLACLVLQVGPATAAGLRRTAVATPEAVRRVPEGRTRPVDRLVVLVLTAVLAVAVADLSGMSKAETERIWLPFAMWLLPATALLPRRGRRAWLTAQAVLALLVNHLLLTGW
ncbi:hypothetical protein ACWCP6_30205 [Streptomyces sp. NPDC002004]